MWSPLASHEVSDGPDGVKKRAQKVQTLWFRDDSESDSPRKFKGTSGSAKCDGLASVIQLTAIATTRARS